MKLHRLLYAVAALLCFLTAGAQTVSPIVNPHVTFVDAAGLACTGCSLYSYVAGTTTPKPTYTDSSGTTPNTNPIVLDVAGGANIWLTEGGVYKFILKSATGSTIWTVDNVTSDSSDLALAIANAALPKNGATSTGTGTSNVVTFPGTVLAPNMKPLGPGSYTFYMSGGTVYARNNNTQTVDYSGTDAAVVINQVLNALANVGGHLYFQNGNYPLNSCTTETVTPYTSLRYIVGIPSTNAVLYPSFYFEGESAGIGSQVHPAVTGAVFTVGTGAESCAGSGNQLTAVWMRPNTAIDTQYPGGTLYWNDHVFFKNLVVNFQSNTRGYETAFDMTEASFAGFNHVQAGFVTASSAAAGSTGPIAFISPATPSDGSRFEDTQVDPGYYIAYEVNTEHSILINTETYRDTLCYAYGWGVSRNNSVVYHNSAFIHTQAYDCINAVAVGTHVRNQAVLDLINFDLEYTTTGPWAASTFVVTGPNVSTQTAGEITWTAIITNVGASGITTPFAADGFSGTYYNQYHNGKVSAPLGVSVAGLGNSAGTADVKLSRALEVHTAGNSPWLEFDGPSGDVALSEYGGNLSFWFCTGGSCTWLEKSTITPTGLNTNGLTVGTSGTTSAQVEEFAQTTGLCTATANSNCTFNVTLPSAMPNTSYSVICLAATSTGIGYLYGGGAPADTSHTQMGFKDASGASNTLSKITCRAWE